MPGQSTRRRSTKPFDAVESAGYVSAVSDCQLEAARLVAAGLSNDEIAKRLKVTVNGLYVRLFNNRRVLDVESDVQIALVMFEVDGPPSGTGGPKNSWRH